MKAPLTTRDASRSLGVSYFTLYNQIRYGMTVAPERDGSGDYIWWPMAIERARKALAAKVRAAK